MKNTGKCPKCGAEDVIVRQSGLWDAYAQHGIRVNFFTTVHLVRYICGQCGFVEDWVNSPEDIARLR